MDADGARWTPELSHTLCVSGHTGCESWCLSGTANKIHCRSESGHGHRLSCLEDFSNRPSRIQVTDWHRVKERPCQDKIFLGVWYGTFTIRRRPVPKMRVYRSIREACLSQPLMYHPVQPNAMKPPWYICAFEPLWSQSCWPNKRFIVFEGILNVVRGS